MINKIIIKKIFLVVLLLQCIAVVSFAQIKYIIKDNLSLVITGSSTLHNWSMVSSKGSGYVTFNLNNEGNITGFASIYFTTLVANLKSDHSGMDKSVYKALKNEANPYITFFSTNGTITSSNGINYILKCNGKLFIAGKTKEVELISNLKINADKSVTVSGIQHINMKDWGIEPPSFMFGTIKSGNEISVKYEVTLKN